MDEQSSEKNPWLDAENRYLTGQEVQGEVTRVTPLGVFVELEPGIEGILYTFELGTGLSSLADFASGQEVHLYVKSIDVKRKRLELALQKEFQSGPLPLDALPPAFRQGDLAQRASWPVASPLPATPFSAEREGQNCANCQRETRTHWKYCIYCGGALLRRCSACGTTQPALPGALYCYECGQHLSSPGI